MYLLDTDTLTYLQAGHQPLIERIGKVKENEMGTTIISSIELLRGRFDFLLKAATGAELLRAQHWLDKTENMLKEILVLPFDHEAADNFERLRHISSYRKIGRADLLIAAITLARQATLYQLAHRSEIGFPSICLDANNLRLSSISFSSATWY